MWPEEPKAPGERAGLKASMGVGVAVTSGRKWGVWAGTEVASDRKGK